MSNKYKVEIKAQKYISGGFLDEIYSDEEYDFSLEFYDEYSALQFIELEEYYFDKNDSYHVYKICDKSKPIKINQENEEESFKELLLQNRQLLLNNRKAIDESLELIETMLNRRSWTKYNT